MTEISTPSGVGRPTVLTEYVVNLLEEAFRYDFRVTEACSYAGISRDAYYEKLKKDPEFTDRMERAKTVPFLSAKRTIMKAVLAGDADLAMRWLSKRDPERYYEKIQKVIKVHRPLDLVALHKAAERL